MKAIPDLNRRPLSAQPRPSDPAQRLRASSRALNSPGNMAGQITEASLNHVFLHALTPHTGMVETTAPDATGRQNLVTAMVDGLVNSFAQRIEAKLDQRMMEQMVAVKQQVTHLEAKQDERMKQQMAVIEQQAADLEAKQDARTKQHMATMEKQVVTAIEKISATFMKQQDLMNTFLHQVLSGHFSGQQQVDAVNWTNNKRYASESLDAPAARRMKQGAHAFIDVTNDDDTSHRSPASSLPGEGQSTRSLINEPYRPPIVDLGN